MSMHEKIGIRENPGNFPGKKKDPKATINKKEWSKKKCQHTSQ